MRTIYITLIGLLGLLTSCNNDDDSSSGGTLISDEVNIAPEAPKLVFPAANQTCIHTNIEYNWEKAVDANGDELAYKIEVASDAAFNTILYSIFTSKTSRSFTMDKGTTFYWRVKAIDNKLAESEYSVIRSFFTEPDAVINKIPYSPEIVAPVKGSTVSGGTITLDWSATDPDGDPLVYDLYFGTSNPPVLIAQDITASNHDVVVTPNSRYYWKIVAKDNKQGVAISPIWDFRSN